MKTCIIQQRGPDQFGWEYIYSDKLFELASGRPAEREMLVLHHMDALDYYASYAPLNIFDATEHEVENIRELASLMGIDVLVM